MPQVIPTVARIFAAIVQAGTAGASIYRTATIILTVASVVSAVASRGGTKSTGDQVSLKLDPQAPIPVALGRTATGGYIIYRAGLGPKNKHLAIVTALSTGPIQAIENFYANDTLCTFTTTSAGPTTISGQWTNKMRQFRLLGETTDAAYDLAVPPFEAELPGWTSAHKTTGFATSLWVNEFDPGRYPTGLPRGLWVVQGEKFYDPRLDSTYPGGLGSHRLATPSTWAYTENPYIMALGWILGRFHNGKKVWGCGVAATGIDWVSYVDGANVADANVWKAGGVVTTGDDKWGVLTAILQAGGGVPVARGGQVSCMVSTPKTSVYAIASTDVIGEISIQTSLPRRNRINKVVPKYRSEANRWQIVAADAVTNSTYLTEDGSEIRTKEVEYSLVQQVNQAAQLAAYDLCNAREGLTMTVTCKPRLLNVRVGEAVTITLDELGLSGQKCIVLGRSFDPATLQVSLTLRSETDAKHAFALGKTGVAPPSPTLTAYDPSTIAAPASGVWTATGGTLSNGTIAQPAILVSGASDDVNAQSVIIEYRPAASGTYRLWAEGPASSTNFEITGVSAATSYVVAVSYRSIRGVVGSRIDLAAVTTGTMTAGTVVGQGFLATQSTVDYQSTVVTGRPQNLNNIVVKPSFGDGTLGKWTVGSVVAVTGQAFTKALQLTPASAVIVSTENDPASPGSRGIRVTPGDKFFFDFWVDASTVTGGQNVLCGLDGGTDAGTYVASTPQVAVSAGTGWQRVTGSGVVPASVTWARPFIFVSGGTGPARFAEITISKSQPGSDVTSTNVASAVTGQGALATKNTATTTDIATNAVTKSATARTAGSISLTAATWTTVQTAAITTSGGDVRVDVSISADLTNLAGATKSLALRIQRDGTTIYTGTLGTALGLSQAVVYVGGLATTDYVEIPGQFSGSNTLFIIDAAPSSAAHTYTVDVNPDGGATAFERNVFLLELKR